MVDILKWGAVALLGVALAGSLVVRDPKPLTAAEVILPDICGDSGTDHGGTSMQQHIDMMAASADEPHAALLQTMEPMHSDMMRGMTAQDFQVAFVCSMVPHHQGAVAMAEVAQRHGTDPFIKMFAAEIISAQNAEILEMQAWLSRMAAAE
jgi:uncharacterized protein (DUF305 family)